ncbi:hypothetical protein EDD18DRAFT_1352722 [Armillaria luteobubalina]|uniref:DUF6535 domain-containing protein n=1 Tax=Armillaria luteobubalina TaxID=153913 RepID=A0AA39Q5Y6_9AGAR|nr:hypothetical protein EDD18DRAFT_1352722 [Armillaria luteobubalina]
MDNLTQLAMRQEGAIQSYGVSCVTISLLHTTPNLQSSETQQSIIQKSKGKPVDPTEHSSGRGKVDGANNDEEKEDAAPINEENDVKPPDPSTSSKAKKTFRMDRAQSTARRGNVPSNYEDRFPEDPMYEETMPNARAWMTHQAESAIHGANMVKEIRDNVDLLLIFVSKISIFSAVSDIITIGLLFSLIVTIFAVRTSQNLQTDYAQVSASLLFDLLLDQRAIANGSPVETTPISSLNPLTAFVPAATDVWMIGLWFTSLFLGLTTAFVAVLVKQWLHH